MDSSVPHLRGNAAELGADASLAPFIPACWEVSEGLHLESTHCTLFAERDLPEQV